MFFINLHSFQYASLDFSLFISISHFTLSRAFFMSIRHKLGAFFLFNTHVHNYSDNFKCIPCSLYSSETKLYLLHFSFHYSYNLRCITFNKTSLSVLLNLLYCALSTSSCFFTSRVSNVQ